MAYGGFVATDISYTSSLGQRVEINEKCLVAVWPIRLAIDLVKGDFPDWSHAEVLRLLESDTEDTMRALADVADQIDRGNEPRDAVWAFLDENGIEEELND